MQSVFHFFACGVVLSLNEHHPQQLQRTLLTIQRQTCSAYEQAVTLRTVAPSGVVGAQEHSLVAHCLVLLSRKNCSPGFSRPFSLFLPHPVSSHVHCAADQLVVCRNLRLYPHLDNTAGELHSGTFTTPFFFLRVSSKKYF